ncbi:MAG: hypothetical protein DPW18_15090 [Chloroflexi bacterium]|nr:hypothetical protein [Chloroflexota bacterium]
MPGPVRQFVFTDTLINGMEGVAVKGRVGVNVCVGVRVGGPGVNVETRVEVSSKTGEGVSGDAPCVNPAITVCAAAVLTAPASGMVKPGNEHASPMDRTTKTRKEKPL